MQFSSADMLETRRAEGYSVGPGESAENIAAGDCPGRLGARDSVFPRSKRHCRIDESSNTMLANRPLSAKIARTLAKGGRELSAISMCVCNDGKAELGDSVRQFGFRADELIADASTADLARREPRSLSGRSRSVSVRAHPLSLMNDGISRIGGANGGRRVPNIVARAALGVGRIFQRK